MREVSSTSLIRVGEPLGLAGDQLEERLALVRLRAPASAAAASGRADHRRHRRAQLVRDERDEVGAKRREAAELLDGLALGLVGADVLHRARHEAAEQAGELDLVLGERVRLGPDEREHPDRAGPLQQWCRKPTAQAEREELLLLGKVRAAHVAPVDRLVRAQELLQQRAVDLPRRAGRQNLVRTRAGHRHHLRGSALTEDDGDPVEREQPAHLADERIEGLRRARARS